MFIDNLEQELNGTFTENGDIAFKSTLDSNLDVFFKSGGMRYSSDSELLALRHTFGRAVIENKELAYRNLIDIRNHRLGGKGERRIFRYLCTVLPETDLIKFVPYIPHIGRWDDLTWLYWKFKTMNAMPNVQKSIVDYIGSVLASDVYDASIGDNISLLAKWLPSENNSSKELARSLAKDLGMAPKEYRKTLSRLRSHIDIVEKRLSNKDYSFDIEGLPSRAFKKYSQALWRHKENDMQALIDKVESGETKIKTAGITPDELVAPFLNRGSFIDKNTATTLEAQWKSLKDLDGPMENILPVIDVSGSMCGKPLEVATGLGLYLSERIRGRFHNTFMTFSSNPELVRMPSKHMTLQKRVDFTMNAKWGHNTNLMKTFDVILQTAVKNELPQEELPNAIVVISDMQFDTAIYGMSTFEGAQKKFKEAGYRLPQIIFWNVKGSSNVPITKHSTGASLVSGYSPMVMNAMMKCDLDSLSPESIMLQQLIKPEYDELIEKILKD